MSGAPARKRRPATYADIEVCAQYRGGWRHVRTVRGGVKLAAKPFDAVEIDLAKAWER